MISVELTTPLFLLFMIVRVLIFIIFCNLFTLLNIIRLLIKKNILFPQIFLNFNLITYMCIEYYNWLPYNYKLNLLNFDKTLKHRTNGWMYMVLIWFYNIVNIIYSGLFENTFYNLKKYQILKKIVKQMFLGYYNKWFIIWRIFRHFMKTNSQKYLYSKSLNVSIAYYFRFKEKWKMFIVFYRMWFGFVVTLNLENKI